MAGDGKLVAYRETMEVSGNDHRVFTSHMKADDGSWQPIMKAVYRRRRGRAH
jgi:hypothetical protein